MNIPTTFTDTFGLEPDPIYTAMEKVAQNFEPGQRYTTAQVIKILEQYKRQSYSSWTWVNKLNKTIDQLVKMEFLKYENGYYYGS